MLRNMHKVYKKYAPVIWFLILRASNSAQTEEHNDCDGSIPIVTTVQEGAVRGSTMMSDRGKPFCAFRGIPFAQPPIGHLRFKPPQPLQPWKGILNALTDPPDCTQIALPFMTFAGQEDCLYLNVYTPQLKPQNGSLLDVMIWIFPGHFYFGTISSKFFEPKFLMDKEIVLVAANYRVGAFGFLSTEDDEAPGNYGMKDQVTAFRWVQNNIKAFGGNPNSVTIFGESSGSASVHYHLLSPMTKGLFHRAICMGGLANMPWARNDNPKKTAIKQAKLLGCPTESSAELVSCLRQKSAKDIQNTLYKMFMVWILPSPGYTPVVEKKTERNPETFLTESPLDAMIKGNIHRVPWLMGHNSQGMGIFLVPLFSAKSLLHYGEKLLKKGILPSLLMLKGSVEKNLILNVTDNITKFYGVDPLHFKQNQEMSWIKLTTDRFFIHGTHRAALLHSLAGHKPIYKYNFAYRGMFSYTQYTSLKNYGVSHADELTYLFQNHLIPISTNDKEVRQLILSLWTNFAKYGNPTPPKSSKASDSSGLLENFVWEPIGDISGSNKHIQYLNIGQVASSLPSEYMNQNLGPVKFHMAVDLLKDEMKFWDSLPLSDNAECLNCAKEYSHGSRTQFCVTTIISVLFMNSFYNLMLYNL